MKTETGRGARHVMWALVAILPAAMFFGLAGNPNVDPITVAPEQHFYVVSVAAIACFALSIVAVRHAMTGGSPRIYLMSLGFLAMAGTFAIHGLATPGFLLDSRYFVVTGFSARISLWLGAFFMAASVASYPPAVARVMTAKRLTIFTGLGASLVAYAVFAMLYPESVPPRVMSATLFLNGTLWSVLAFSLVAAVGYLRLYLRTGAPIYGAVAAGAVLMAEAQISMHFGELWRWSWWLYHLQMLGAFVAMLSFPFAAREVEREQSPAHLPDSVPAKAA